MPWQLCAHSVPGAMHTRSGMPNQDAVDHWRGAEERLPILLALADGHGSRHSYRSAEGARLAVDAVLDALRDLLADEEAGAAKAARDAARRLPPALVRRWQDRVQRDLAAHPLSGQVVEVAEVPEEESVPAGADRSSPYVVYGTTCLCAAVLPGILFLGQLGDGDIVTVDAAGRAHRPLPEDARHFANETTSLCSEDAAAAMRCTTMSLGGRQAPELVLLATDGYANSFASDEDFLRVATDLREIIREEGFPAVSGQLEGWLREASAEGSGDDITVGLLYRSPEETR